MKKFIKENYRNFAFEMRIFARGKLKAFGGTLIFVAAIGAQVEAQSEGQALHVFVGKSVVINMQAPVTRVLSSNPGVIDTLATTSTQIIVGGKAPGQSSLILWDNQGHSQILDVTVDINILHLKTAPSTGIGTLGGYGAIWHHSCDEILGVALTMSSAQQAANPTADFPFVLYTFTVPIAGQHTLVELSPVPSSPKDSDFCLMEFPSFPSGTNQYWKRIGGRFPQDLLAWAESLPLSNGPGTGIGPFCVGGVGSGVVGSSSGGGIGVCARPRVVEGVFRIGGGVSAPRAIYAPDPEYPEEAHKGKYQGTVVLSLIVGADGVPRDIKVARSVELGLDEKAIETVKTWKFEAGMKDGKPVATYATIDVAFHWKDDAAR